MALGFLITLIIFLLFLPFLRTAAVGGDIFYPTAKEKVLNMLALAKVSKGEKMYDIGSGDGRIVYAFARAGAEAYGIENNHILYFYSLVMSRIFRLKNTHFICKSFWEVNISNADIVTLFIIPPMMKPMIKKLKNELRPGTKVLSYAFECPELTFLDKKENVYLYKI